MNLKQENSGYNIVVDSPYPPIQSEVRQNEYAYAMLSNIGSAVSEMSTISSYVYNSVILSHEYGDLAECFHKMSIVEMHHLKIFASFALQMGADPRLWSLNKRRPHYWTPAYNNYPREIREMIENSIRGEEGAVQKYTRQTKTIRDANIIENLERIIIDEQRHIEVLHEMLESIH